MLFCMWSFKHEEAAFAEREREGGGGGGGLGGGGGKRSVNYVELLRSKLCGITVLVSLMQYS